MLCTSAKNASYNLIGTAPTWLEVSCLHSTFSGFFLPQRIKSDMLFKDKMLRGIMQIGHPLKQALAKS
ncbi:hypothetical protein AVDCRST_MAG81-3726 [uncultured Synechococcales cyanobacterium]|uniref:Uncharacterized protein n=1 Tax=uncultured Synechococcales cyanobacterium TaxID=1936017 RepID=A0A6J4VRB2_9CYAN|nr:hypothetical protein AVDCRST_MAG81-3726 [uncultured Synechococcales cyanobacterium]